METIFDTEVLPDEESVSGPIYWEGVEAARERYLEVISNYAERLVEINNRTVSVEELLQKVVFVLAFLKQPVPPPDSEARQAPVPETVAYIAEQVEGNARRWRGYATEEEEGSLKLRIERLKLRIERLIRAGKRPKSLF